jgi:hypothetical protein
VSATDASHPVPIYESAIKGILPLGLDMHMFRDMKGKVVLVTG